MSFDRQLQIGKIGESHIAQWFNSRGFHVLPVYEKEIAEGKGPTLFMADGIQHVAPDMIAFKNQKTYWIEAKHKTAFTWHRKTKRWTTGIDLRHYYEYQVVQRAHPEWAIWILFLHQCGVAKDTPIGITSPSGLFGGTLSYLSNHENHRHPNCGRSGMVYWAADTLTYIAPLSMLEAA